MILLYTVVKANYTLLLQFILFGVKNSIFVWWHYSGTKNEGCIVRVGRAMWTHGRSGGDRDFFNACNCFALTSWLSRLFVQSAFYERERANHIYKVIKVQEFTRNKSRDIKIKNSTRVYQPPSAERRIFSAFHQVAVYITLSYFF